MNWGYKILLGILAFVSGIIAMVVIAYKQTNEMEDEKYYVKELTYQQVIDAKKNLAGLADTLAVTDSAGTIFVKLPQKSFEGEISGKMEFLRPSDKSKDVFMDVNPESNGVQAVSKKLFSNGMYKLRINWQNNNVPYYKEQVFTVKDY